jgi:hypothetical protein
MIPFAMVHSSIPSSLSAPFPSENPAALAAGEVVAAHGMRLASQARESRRVRGVARIAKGLARDGAMLPDAPVAVPQALAGLTVAEFLDPSPAVYGALIRLATSAAKRGRLCGSRGRRASWGTPSDTGGVVPLPVATRSADDEEAACDAIGVVWARAQAGKLGGPADPAPIGRVYTKARNLGRLRSQRRIREGAPLTVATDRMLPVYAGDAAGMSRAELLALVPPARRGAAARALDASTATESQRTGRYRLPPVTMPDDVTAPVTRDTIGDTGEPIGVAGGWFSPAMIAKNATTDGAVP